MNNFIEDLKNEKVLLFDGPRGTGLSGKGLEFGEETTIAHVNNPNIVIDLAKATESFGFCGFFYVYHLNGVTIEQNVMSLKRTKNRL